MFYTRLSKKHSKFYERKGIGYLPTKLYICPTPTLYLQTFLEVAARVVRQLEYYFGDRNLRKDRFMLREVTLDEGWISLETMLNFKRFVCLITMLNFKRFVCYISSQCSI